MENILITPTSSAFASLLTTAASGGSWFISGSQQGFSPEIEIHREDHEHVLHAAVLGHEPHRISIEEFIATGEASPCLVVCLLLAVVSWNSWTKRRPRIRVL